MTPRRTPLSLALAVAAALALAGCSAGGSTASGGADAGPAAQDGAAPAAPAPAPAKGEASGGDATKDAGAAPGAAVKQRVIRTAQVVVEVDGQLAPAAAKVRAAAQGLGGTVSSETTSFSDTPEPRAEGDLGNAGETSGDGSTQSAKPPVVARPGQSVLVLRVPEDALDRAMALISGPGGVGKEVSRSATAQDVTGDLADLQSRVATQRASVQRIRALLSKAGSLRAASGARPGSRSRRGRWSISTRCPRGWQVPAWRFLRSRPCRRVRRLSPAGPTWPRSPST